MGKKKIIGLCLAVGLMVGVVGGSLAWFTDTDKVTNSFSTAGENNEGDKNGIIIDEIWNAEEAKNILPGTTVNKDVRVKNHATYDQLIRVKFTVLDKSTGKKLDLSKVKLNFVANKGENWIEKTTDETTWYYYNKVVGADQFTEYLLDSVKLLGTAGEEYKNGAFDVVVDAEGVQAANGAVGEVWSDAPDEIKKLGGVIKE